VVQTPHDPFPAILNVVPPVCADAYVFRQAKPPATCDTMGSSSDARPFHTGLCDYL
jgi:hypothetical protein